MFVVYNKVKIRPANEQKLKLRITSYFAGTDICFRKEIMKSKNAYFIHANVDEFFIFSRSGYHCHNTNRCPTPIRNANLIVYIKFQMSFFIQK